MGSQILLFFFFFAVQGLTLARQILCYLSHFTSPRLYVFHKLYVAPVLLVERPHFEFIGLNGLLGNIILSLSVNIKISN
jgi:hypothetical protein